MSETNQKKITVVKREPRTKLKQMDLIDGIMTDRYQNLMSTTAIKERYGISHKVYKSIDAEWAEEFKSRFGERTNTVTKEEMLAYWHKKALNAETDQ